MPELVCAVASTIRDGSTVEAILEAAEELARFPGVELLEPVLDLAERRLASALEKLSTVRRFSRRRERAELQVEVSLQRAAVNLARRHLAALQLSAAGA
jgi:hypothetical protein